MNKTYIEKRLDYLRGEIQAERISYGEIAELCSLKDHIAKDDVVLLEWAEVSEHEEEIKRHVPKAEDVKDHLKVPAMTIAINYSDCNEGYMYTIHNGEPDTLEEDPNGFDRGLCTGTMEDALGMAVEQAEVLAGLLADKFDRETT